MSRLRGGRASPKTLEPDTGNAGVGNEKDPPRTFACGGFSVPGPPTAERSNTMKNKQLRCITEGAVLVALSLALSYLKIPIGLAFGGFGGSIDLVMIPLIVFAVHRGLGWGLLAGLLFGTIKYFIGTHADISWISIIFDYSVAYMFVGFAGVMRRPFSKGRGWALPVGALIGCIFRFIIHYISGVTVYAQWMPEEFMNMKMTSPAVYSLLYNGTYMLPNTILAVVLCILLVPLMKKLPSTKN